MRKAEFAAASRAQAGPSGVKFDGQQDIQEIQVMGDWAFMWSRLRVVATPADGSASVEREGHTLTIFRKEQGRWRLARDANLLGAPKPANG
jgi:ketosteroid isomerase-like protein